MFEADKKFDWMTVREEFFLLNLSLLAEILALFGLGINLRVLQRKISS